MSDPVSQNGNGSSNMNNTEQPASSQGSGQSPIPPQSAPKRAAKMPPAGAPTLAPPGHPTSAYKPVNPSQNADQQSGKKRKKGGNKLLIVGIIVCVLAVAALVCTLLFVMNKPAESTPQRSEANVPSNSQIIEALEDANLKPPDISSYKYISTEDITGPEFTEIQTEQGSSSNVCNVSAKSVFKNSYVIIEQPVALRFTQKDNEWISGTVTTSPSDVIPAGAPDIQALIKDLPDMLAEYDKTVADQFKNCDIVADSKDLTAKGGTAKFTLEKSENGAVKKCDVTMKLEWKSDTGWSPQIESIGNITTSDNQNQGGSAEEPSDEPEAPDALLQCNSGDLVQIPGIIDYVSDRFLLRADNYIRVEIDGKVFNSRYFELQSNTMQFTVGSHVEITGAISETGVLRQAPLVLNLDI